MRKLSKNILAAFLSMAMVITPLPTDFGNKAVLNVNAAEEDDYTKAPVARTAGGRIGAKVPYYRYDSEMSDHNYAYTTPTYNDEGAVSYTAQLVGNAENVTSVDFDRMNIASQASNQSYVNLPNSGSAVTWTIEKDHGGNGVTMRFTMPDSGSSGQTGSVEVWVSRNGGAFQKERIHIYGKEYDKVELNSYWMWQYFAGGNPNDTNDGGAPCFAFDEVHFMLSRSLGEGDKIQIRSTGANGLAYGIDFLEIEQVADELDAPKNAIDVTSSPYNADPTGSRDSYSAIQAAISAADAQNRTVYFPEGTYNINQIWRLYGSDIKVMGAGMWYTKIQFTNSDAGAGGISGGWQTSGSLDGYCNNVEFCHMYINSNLSSRYNQNAVYKCFMDVFTDNSEIHDIWEDHFECGFWCGDYNGKTDYCDGLKIYNSRIRNNLADGVNFCQGTSNAVVYNCNIRNCGDDGLAMWNNNDRSAKDEVNNVFAYNTIDFIWRAGGIAIYGGGGHQIYNNYIRDTFLSSGIHLNTEFSGYKFNAASSNPIVFRNNVLVRTGCNADSWGEDLSGVDLKGGVTGVEFYDTEIYDSQHQGMRFRNTNGSSKFVNTTIYGVGLDGTETRFEAEPHSAVAIKTNNNGSFGNASFTNTKITNIPPDIEKIKGEDINRINRYWPYFGTTLASLPTAEEVEENNDLTYSVVGYPAVDGSSQGGGDEDLLEGLVYDLTVTGIEYPWQINSGSETTIYAAVKNNGSDAIPAKVKVGTKFEINGSSYTTSFSDGIGAGQTKIVSVSFIPTAGKNSLTVTTDYQDKLPGETNENNNSMSKKFDARDGGANKSYTPVTGGIDFTVTDVTYFNATKNSWGGPISVGDQLYFGAYIANAGNSSAQSGKKIGLQYQVDGKAYPNPITWCDTYKYGMSGNYLEENLDRFKATGGNSVSAGYWVAESGTHTVTAIIDDDSGWSEVNENNNTNTTTLTIPYSGIDYWGTQADDPDDLGQISDDPQPYTDPVTQAPTTVPPTQAPTAMPPTQAPTTQAPTTQAPTTQVPPTQPPTYPEPISTYYIDGYDLSVAGVAFENASGSTDLKVGDMVTISAAIKNLGKDLPAGTPVNVVFTVDDNSYTNTITFTSGLAAGKVKTVSVSTPYQATIGGHEIKVSTDINGSLNDDSNTSNNTKRKNVNVTYKPNTSYQTTNGVDFAVTDLTYVNTATNEVNGSINAGDTVRFVATITNVGTQTVPSGSKLGIQFQINGNTSGIVWNDELKQSNTYCPQLAPGESVTLTSMGGNNDNGTGSRSNGTWVVPGNNNYTITGWVNDTNNYANEYGGYTAANNYKSITLSIPVSVNFNDNVDDPDDLDAITDDEIPTQAPTTVAPTTQAPTTQAPTTQAPTTQAPTTQAPTTHAPTTQPPTEPPTEAPVYYNVSIDGDFVASVKKGSTYTLPSASIAGYAFGGKMYKVGSTVTVNGDMAFSSVEISSDYTLSYLMNANSGIQYKMGVDGPVTSDIKAAGAVLVTASVYKLFKNVTKSLAPARASVVTANEIAADGTFKVGLAGLSDESAYIEGRRARAYLDITYTGNGETTPTTVYGAISDESSLRGMATITRNSAGFRYMSNANKEGVRVISGIQ